MPQTNEDGFPIVGSDSSASSSNLNADGFPIIGGTPATSSKNTSPSYIPPTSGVNEDGFAFLGSPLTGQTPGVTGAHQHVYQDSSQPWYKRAFDFANTPLTESLLGLPETRQGAGGFERGVEKLVGGLTSPLSLALGAATLGTGSIIEGAGAAALRESGEFAPEEIASVLKGSKAAIAESKALRPIELVISDAIKAKGGDELLSLVNDAKSKLGPLANVNDFGEEGIQKSLASQGFSEGQLQQLTGASETAKKAASEFTPISDAVREAGVDPSLYKRAQDFLSKNGLDEERDLLGGNPFSRGAFQILRKTLPSIPIATTAEMARGANTLLNAGFTLQQFQTAAQMSPMFLDALKEGDYDKAWEYGTEAAAGTLLGVLGAPHALHSAGELFHPLLESDKLRPSDEWAAIQRANQDREATHAVAEQHAINIYQTALGKAGLELNPGPLGWSKEQLKVRQDVLDRVQIGLHTGGDLVKAQALYDALKRAVGEGGEGGTPVAPVRPLIGPNPDAWHSLENEVNSLVPGKEIRMVTTDDLTKAGASPELVSRWKDYQNRPNPVPMSHAELDPLVRVQTVPEHQGLAPNLILNNYAHEAIVRAIANANTKPPDRGWRGFRIDSGGLISLADSLDKLGSSLPNRGNYGALADQLRGLAKKYSAVNIAKRDADFTNIMTHEAVHGWQEQHSVTPPPELINSPEYRATLKTLEKRGYDPHDPDIHHEILTHLSEGDNLGLGSSRALTLAKNFLKLYTPEQLRDLPSQSPTILKALQELGHDPTINRSAVDRLLQQASGVFRLGPEGSQTGGQETGPQGNRGNTGARGLQTNQARELTPDEEKEYDKLSTLSLRGGVGDARTAGIVTNDGTVKIGRLHDDLIRQAGYKASSEKELYEKFFEDGGVRIRTYGGVVNIDFMDSNPETWDRVHQALDASPEAGKYHIEFRQPGGGSGFQIKGYYKDQVKYELDDWEEGRARQAAPGSVSYFRQNGPVNGLFSREKENTAPVWYLKSNQLIDSRMQGPMPADTVLKMLENNGVKPDELKYTGLSEFLKDKGKAPVRPDELREYLAANNLQVQEVMKGVPPTFSPRFMELGAMGANRTQAQEREWGDLGDKEGWDPENPTKFGTYTLPGAEPGSYREMLLTLPENGSPKIGTQRQYTVYNENGQAFRQGLLPMGPEARAAIAQHPEWRVEEGTAQNPNDVRRDTQNFRSSHFPDEVNPVGHVRFNDRTGPNGEKLLHLEELQSDWHQKGRTRGYAANPSELDELRGNLAKARAAWKKANEDFAKASREDQYGEVGERLQQANQRQFDAESALDKASGALPDAPFKKTWPELLFKRMTRYAAEHGYDGISWTPGEEQAARYDLSKHIDGIKYQTPGVEGDGKLLIYKDGRLLTDLGYVKPEDLPDRVGKEVTQKLLNTAPSREGYHELSGLDLKVGGEGMKGFYDKIVPELANKLGKQFGAKVGETKIKIPSAGRKLLTSRSADWRPEDAEIIHRGDRNQYEVWSPGIEDPVRRIRGTYDDRASAEQRVEEQRTAKGKIKTVPYFPITDSLRESVMKQGQPLFARERPLNGLPDNVEDLIRSNVFKDQPKEYQDRIFGALEDQIHGRYTQQINDAIKYLREEDDKNFQIGSTYNLIHQFVQDHMTRQYKDKNPEGRVVSAQAKTGKFATNVSQAKQQVYDSFATALLKSPKEINFDPAGIISGQRGDIIKAAANRQLIDTLRDKFTRASDGRPAVVLGGSGRVVAGENGENPTTFVSPERIRLLHIAPNAVEAMRKSGDLERFLEDGTVKDLTPKVRPDTVGAAISRLEEQGISKDPTFDQEGNVILRKNIQLLKDIRDGKRPYSDLKEYNDTLKPVLAWDPQDYISLNHGAFKDWNFVTNDTSGNRVMVKADIRVHPEFAEYLQNRLGLKESAVASNPIGRGLLGAATATKHVLLSLSPFHMAQEALRAIMVGVNPFGITAPDILTGERVDPSDPNSPTIIKKAVEHGLTTGTDYKSLQEHSEGLSAGGGVLRLIPGVGKTIANSLDFYQDYLFKRYIPALKARSTELLFNQYREAHPEWSTDRIAKVTAQHVNRTFGGIPWQQMGRSATTQDWGRLMLLAPDWLESEMRSGAALFNKEEGGLSRKQVATMALSLWGVARVLNYATTGNFHNEAPFGLAVKNKEGKETVFGIRTLPTDLLHAASDPVGFMRGRLSPVFRTGEELVSGRDQFGRKLGPEDMWSDVFHQMMPIPAQSIGQAVTGTGPEIGNVGQGWRAVGGTAQTYSSPAQQLAANLAANHTESGPIDPAQMARHRRVMQFEDQARSGELSWPDLMKMVYSTDQLSEAELKQIQKNVKETQGMDPSMASLYTRASRLPAKEFLDLWDISNPREKTALVPLMTKVQKNYLPKAKKEMTPEDRQRDPTFNRLLNMIPPQQPQTQQ